MKIKYVLAIALVAMFAIPGTASQLAIRGAQSSPFIGVFAGIPTGGTFQDPNVEPRLSITLPTRFQALNIGTHPLETFRG